MQHRKPRRPTRKCSRPVNTEEGVAVIQILQTTVEFNRRVDNLIFRYLLSGLNNTFTFKSTILSFILFISFIKAWGVIVEHGYPKKKNSLSFICL